MLFEETIAAIATPAGKGGVGIVRLSGRDPLSVAAAMFTPSGKTAVADFAPYRMYPGTIDCGGFTDYGMAVYFKAPHSYTGEDVVEFQCHGGESIVRGILKRALSLGARSAGKGEFTKRAFLNGKLSLASAEGIADMINGESEAEVKAGYMLYTEKLTSQVVQLQERIKNLLSEQYNMGVQLKNSDLKLLQAQINPHFLYNTLNLIKWTAQTKDSEEVADIVDKLSSFYRVSLSNGLDLISIRDELTHVTLYVQLQNKRFDNNIHLETNISPDVYDFHILKLLLQPLVENSIVHGLQNKPGSIRITISKTSDFLSIIIADNGCGISKEDIKNIFKRFYSTSKNSNSIGIGLNMAKLILEKQNAKIEVESELHKYTIFKIIFPK